MQFAAMVYVRCIIGLSMMLVFYSSKAQQLLVLKKEKVKAAFAVDDEIRYTTVRDNSTRNDKIVYLSDTVLITRGDTLRLHHLNKVYFSNSKTNGSKVTSAAIKLIAAGVLLSLGDFITVTAVQDNEYTMNKGVTVVSSSLIVAGAGLLIFKKPYIRIGKNNRLRVVNKTSPFYQK